MLKDYPLSFNWALGVGHNDYLIKEKHETKISINIYINTSPNKAIKNGISKYRSTTSIPVFKKVLKSVNWF